MLSFVLLQLEPLFRYDSCEWSGESKGGSTNCTTRIPWGFDRWEIKVGRVIDLCASSTRVLYEAS
ncbi:BZ3500_MvSof-1268-A1-R1_Chr8-2g10229 [Microbotryum saponariae]|uniref:BZ3500_MvSof-1268-A1-R1_Chr8-2g10229 protein n=1 Tax=Microbotryum saponariae TaxID=289078 RepID=A0A2X0NAN7_9BASI|nr:BZ3500_MvSof-1268-A1-R1_Chr8-2g10229 [Microbotryum saponariae]SDA02027.1 BZ3501_MvSof-1269-A2-R1_Chr8-2g09979 [Microbotryum saponariae]